MSEGHRRDSEIFVFIKYGIQRIGLFLFFRFMSIQGQGIVCPGDSLCRLFRFFLDKLQ